MTDTMMIRDCIRSQGMKLGHVAHVLGITRQTRACGAASCSCATWKGGGGKR